MVTLKEIAEECNVSATTVSNILNGKNKVSEETRERVLEVVNRRGYKPNYIAQGLRRQKTKMIGIITEDIAQFTAPAIVEGIMGYCEEQGYRTIVKNMRMYARRNDSRYSDEHTYRSILDPTVQEVASLMVDGVIYIAGHTRTISCFSEGFGLPAVVAYAYSENPKVPSVLVDDEVSAHEMALYLISKGHRRIGVIGGNADNFHTQRRLVGYQRALFEAGIPFNPQWVQYARWDKDSAYRAANKLLQTDVTAVFCMSDRMAGGLYCALGERGLQAGKDIAVAGFDNQDIAEYFLPGLTTMELPLNEIGTASARMLLDQIGDAEGTERKTQEEILIPCRFVERDSVQAIE